MGNTLRTPGKLRSSSKKGRPPMEDLSGWEIEIQPHHESAFDVLPEPAIDGSAPMMKDQSHTTSTADMTETGSPRSSYTSRGGNEKRKLSRRPSAEDLMACIIPGMDPLEMLQLVEQCAQEEMREKELDESSRRHSRELDRKTRARSGRKRVKNALSPHAA